MAELLGSLQGGDAQAFEALLQMLMATDNEQRSQGEQVFKQLQQSPDICATHLIRGLRSSSRVELRSLCAVLLRRVLTRDEPLWPSLSPPTKQAVKAELLGCLQQEQERAITRKICDSVSELAIEIYDSIKDEILKSQGQSIAGDRLSEMASQVFHKEQAGWPELLPFIFQCVQSGQPSHSEIAFLIFEQLARFVMDQLIQYLATIHGALTAGLSNHSLDVKIAAFAATTTFIGSLEKQSDREKFQPMVPLLLGVLGDALNAGDEIAANSAVERLIEVADEHPRFLRKQLPDVAGAMIKIAQADSLDDGTRRLAAEFLVTLCEAREKAPGMMRKLPQLIQQLFDCCMDFLLEVEDDPDWHTAEDEKNEDAGETELFEFGQECLDRIALAIGGKSLIPVAAAKLTSFMQSEDWRSRQASLVCLAQIAEGCEKVMRTEAVMGDLVGMCVKGTADPHPKVRWAACQAIGQLCTDLGPDFQENHHAAVVQALLGLMDDFQNPRVQAHSCAAIVNFAEGCDQDVMAPYLDGLISKALGLLQGGRKNVQEGALTALASIADCSREYFIKYYDSCIPLLRHILENANDKSHRMMRAKALECISLVGMAVGKERFAADAGAIMQYIQQVQNSGLESDDPFASYMLQAGARICTTLGQDFIPYLPVVMPPMLKAASEKPDFKVEDDDDEDAAVEEEDDTETFFVGGRRVSLHTTALEEKATACSMLCCFAYELKEGFSPYVEEVTKIMVPLLKFYFNEEIRIAAAQTLPELLKSYVEAASKGMGPGEESCKQLVGYMWPALVDALSKEIDPDVVHTLLTSVEEMIDAAKGPALMALDLMGPVFDAFKSVLNDYEERRDMRMKRTEGEDFDAEEEEALQEEHEAESELLDALGNCCTAILRLYGDAALPLIETIMPPVARLLHPSRYSEERRVALILMDDIIQFSPQGAEKYFGEVIPQLLGGATDQDAGIRQCSVYGLGRAAQHKQANFRQHAPEAVTRVLAVISSPEARSEDNILATENAVGALGKFLEFQQEFVDPSSGTIFVQNLPLEEDQEEAKEVHAQLVKFVSANDARILGQNNSNLPKIAEVLVRVLSEEEKLARKEDIPQMVALLNQVRAALPPSMIEEYVKALKPKQQQNLQSIIS